MENDFLDDIFEDEPIFQPEASPEEQPPTEDDSDLKLFEDEPSEDLVSNLLQARGIDPSKITIVDENGEETEVDFNSLSKEEQLDLLNSGVEQNDYDLDDSEVDLLNTIRESGKSVEEFLEDYKQQILSELPQQEHYDIDAYDDDELYVMDLKDKFPNWEDDKILAKLESAKQNEEIFKEEVDHIRQGYKQLEDEYKQAQTMQVEQQREENYNNLVNTMVGVAEATNEMFEFELDTDDKNEVLSYLLDLDESGTSEFYKALNDPETLFKLAWFAKKGEEAFDVIQSAYKSEIAQRSRNTKVNAVGNNKPTPRKTPDTFDQGDLYDSII